MMVTMVVMEQRMVMWIMVMTKEGGYEDMMTMTTMIMMKIDYCAPERPLIRTVKLDLP